MTKHTTDSARRILAIGTLALLGSAGACKAKKAATPAAAAVAVDTTPVAPEPEPVAVAPAPVVVAPVEEIRPRCDQFTIRDSGIGAIEIGDARDAIPKRCAVLGDSIATDAADGNVVIGVNGVPVLVQVAENKVYRITLTDPQFRTEDGLGAGIPIAGMLELPGAVVLEGEHDLSVVVSAHCGLYFRITKPTTLPANAARWSDVVRAMPQGTPVERVVIHGCR
ncbi:MAG TPA: hypothetical protein VFN38_09175 [Gemmatimonadaceae bacterium]|nr:hypothetical protein [Gemmatimonadaceae bacterium]